MDLEDLVAALTATAQTAAAKNARRNDDEDIIWLDQESRNISRKTLNPLLSYYFKIE